MSPSTRPARESSVRAPQPGAAAQRHYSLAHEPDGRSWTARENLTDVLHRELLGPSEGPEELIEVAPDVRYLVGRIAPVRLLSGAAGDGDDDEVPDLDLAEARDGRGVPASGVEEERPDGSEDAATAHGIEDEPQKRGLMIPASMGLRFQVPLDLDHVTVTARWGVYRSVKTEKVSASGRPIRAYQRTDVALPVRMALGELTPGETASYPLVDDVTLRVDTYAEPHRGCRLVEIALCNDRETPRKIPMDAWMFQTELSVAAGGEAAFLPVTDVLADDWYETDDELRRLNLQYRKRLEFAVGRTCSADWTVAEGARRATTVRTTWLPTSETPQTRAVEIDGALLDMTALATADVAQLEWGLRPIVDGYRAWLNQQERETDALPDHLRADARDAVIDATQVADQLADGLAFLLSNVEARRCFAFMNQVMADQRIQTQVSERRTADPRLSRAAAREAVLAQGATRAHSWRTFQLAFVLMQLRGLTEPTTNRRSGHLAKVELLFFPTGGGKTEAYLGLAAYAFAIRRRQGVVDGADGALDGRSGVTVLMRYTLRLLTSQQFQRATAMVCAAELIRRSDEDMWGTEPLRIGLWVGTDVSPKRFEEADEQLRKVNDGQSHRLTVRQIQRCPWCGTRIDPKNVRADGGRRRVLIFCGDDLAECPFADGGSVVDGLPVLTVDEEIYRLAPAFVIATVDKFARLAREGHAAALFGYVRQRCDRHGFVHDDYLPCSLKDGSKHPAKDGLPAAALRPVARLRPPDLIIQDELHLITGALGTTVGLFEIAIDAVTTWRSATGERVKPLIVASTATVRNAADQIRGLYGRGVTIFPPQVLDVADTFFSTEVPVDEHHPGRRYLGISTTGVRLTAAEVRIAEVLLAAGQFLLDHGGVEADPYLSLVGYFSAVRELAGMTRYLSDDVQTALAKGRPWTGLPRRTGTDYGNLNIAELTSRVASADITSTLDQMAVSFDPAQDSTASKARFRSSADTKVKMPGRERQPYDAILATAMLQVGVDVTRLGLMLMVGQPKNTAEYIQASSRVGRDPARPGLVVTLGNWARPRDLAHYEQFRHYHETFYAQVEALSVTPFSATSIERGLDGVLVSVARVLDAARADGLSPEKAAYKVEDEHSLLVSIIDTLTERALAASGEESAEAVRLRLLNRLGQWQKHRAAELAKNKVLVYERVTDTSGQSPLMISAEKARSRSGQVSGAPFVVPNSMREVQPEINLLVSPVADKLFAAEPPGTRQFVLPTDGTEA
ncbi:hypothetical protein FHX74_000524 [Friedmanniella endophytica]|uniref:Helicase C-terminal domain-containing protein n=1 Tax=Microlunatus kandeliicorticis TaxID=1759536 RepID=A0A7W3P4L6_9ACTN|nr:DISARM system helicase DrmA [Microlunatus kandeliicorticis]MBA8792930.1 hypothetical protein [Microlunatus kandeliicorticis]